MERILILLLCCVMARHTFAQEYEMALLALDKDGNPAVVLSGDIDQYESERITEEVNGLTYSSLYLNVYDYLKIYAPPGPGKNGYFREYVDCKILIREADGVVYRYNEETGSEQELLNYNLAVGDEFTRPDGQRFVVEDKKTDEIVTLWLRDVETGVQDVWRSDCGSLTTGYLLRYDVPGRTITNLIRTGRFGYYTLDTEHVKQILFQPWQLTYEESMGREGIRYSFEGNALRIKGCYKLRTIPCPKFQVIRCIRNGSNVYIAYEPGEYDTTALGMYGYNYFDYDVTIDGFEPGVYCINGYNAENLSLECKGLNNDATGISSVDEVQAKEDSEIYDLTGRRLDHEPAQGLFIKDGRKVLKR